MIEKPSQKSVMSSAMKVGAGVVGAKVSDGVVGIMPESTANYKKGLVAGLALIAAAAISPKTTAGEAVQAAFVGMAVKQGTDALTDVLVPAIDAQDNSTATGKFLNAVIGHSTVVAPEVPADATTARLNRALRASVEWEPTREIATRTNAISLV